MFWALYLGLSIRLISLVLCREGLAQLGSIKASSLHCNKQDEFLSIELSFSIEERVKHLCMLKSEVLALL